MQRKLLQLTGAMLLAAALILPANALAQTGGLDEYQEGAPTAGGEQGGVPGGGSGGSGGSGSSGGATHEAGGGSSSGSSSGGSSESSGGSTESSGVPAAPATDTSQAPTSPTQPDPAVLSEGSSAAGSGGSNIHPNNAQDKPSGHNENGGAGGRSNADKPATTSTPETVTSTPASSAPADDSGGSSTGLILGIAVALLALAGLGYLLYRRRSGAETAATQTIPAQGQAAKRPGSSGGTAARPTS